MLQIYTVHNIDDTSSHLTIDNEKEGLSIRIFSTGELEVIARTMSNIVGVEMPVFLAFKEKISSDEIANMVECLTYHGMTCQINSEKNALIRFNRKTISASLTATNAHAAKIVGLTDEDSDTIVNFIKSSM